MNKIIDKICRLLRFGDYRLKVIADPRDNSITLSKGLFEHMKRNNRIGDKAQVFVFRIPKPNGTMAYGFSTTVPDQPTVVCDIQYNDLHRTVGFESLCPSVNWVFNDLGLPHDKAAVLKVKAKRLRLSRLLYYEIIPPSR